jgi:hypothetical protein
MMLRFTENATTHEREAVAAAAARREVGATATPGGLILEGAVADEDILLLAAMPGVAEIGPDAHGPETVFEAVLGWVAGAATVFGLLAIVASNLPATVGLKADPLRTPGVLRPSWPLYPWYSAVDRAPSWVPVPFLFVLALFVLLFWPNLARRVAEKSPLLHTVLGVAALLAVAGLVALEVAR